MVFKLGDTVSISVSTSSAAQALQPKSSKLYVANAGSAVAFFHYDSAESAEDATTGDIPVLPGQSIIVSVPLNTAHVSAITAASTSTLYVTPVS